MDTTETSGSNDELSDRIRLFETENAQLKATILDLRGREPREETSRSDKNKNQEQQEAVVDAEVVQLRREVSRLKMELKESQFLVAGKSSALEEKELRNGELVSSVKDLQLQLQSVKEEFQRFRQQSVANAERCDQQVHTLSEQLIQERKGTRHQRSKSLIETFPEHCDQPFLAPFLQTGTSFGEDTQSTDIDWSIGHDSPHEEVEECHKKIHQLTQSLRSMANKQKDVQRRLVEAQDERDYMKSVTEDLQQQLDALSPRASAELRAKIQSMETELNSLETENSRLRTKLHKPRNLAPVGTSQDKEADAGVNLTPFASIELDGACPSHDAHSETGERLMDCSLEIMGELANAATDMDIGVSLSFVQYAGLLASVQKAIKQLELSKQDYVQSLPSFRDLDRSLSKTLSISRIRLRGALGEREKRLDTLQSLIAERESGLKFMNQMLADLRLEVKGHETLTLHQEVQMEYIKQQLSASDKVISLTWELENVKRALDECQRELKAQRDLYEQQQQELTIQWQSKQQAVAENLSQNHRVFSFSRQLEHVSEAKEELELEKQELEETLERTQVEIGQLKEKHVSEISSLHEETAFLRTELKKDRSHTSMGLLDYQVGHEILQELAVIQSAVDCAALQAHDSVAQQKTSWLEKLTDIANDCAVWKKDSQKLISEKAEQRERLEEVLGMLSTAEALQKRAEQEKQGLQEILSLTSETTSSEILNLQTQLNQITTQLEAEKQTSKDAGAKTAEILNQLQQRDEVLAEERDLHQQQLQTLEQKLEIATNETSNLENRMRIYTEVISGLNKDVSENASKKKELNKIAEQNANAFRAEKEKGQRLQQKLETLTGDLEQSAQEIGVLNEKKRQLDILRQAMERLEGEKARLQGQLGQFDERNAEQQVVEENLRQQIEELQEMNNEFMRDRRRLGELLIEEQQNLARQQTKWEAEIGALIDNGVSRNQWPPGVLLLVNHCEQLLREGIENEGAEKLLQLQSVMEAKERESLAKEAEVEEDLVECAEECRSLRETVEDLQLEMREREAVLQKEMTHIKESSAELQTDLETKLEELREAYDGFEEETNTIVTNLRIQTREKERQLSDVQEKAREMMKERDEEIDRLKYRPLTAFTTVDLDTDRPLPQNPTEADLTIHKLTSDVTFLRHLVFDLTSSLEESERTHELRSKADEVLRSEVTEFERSKRREGLNVDYLKNVLINAFEKGTLPKASPMFTILARLLEFSEEEMERINKSQAPGHHPISSSSSSSSFFSAWTRS